MMCLGMEEMCWSSEVTKPLLQTLPVGSLVFSVLAKDKDTGAGGAVVYSIEKVSVCGSTWECGRHLSSWPPGSSISHTTCRDLAEEGLCDGPALVPTPSSGPPLDLIWPSRLRRVPAADQTLLPTLSPGALSVSLRG